MRDKTKPCWRRAAVYQQAKERNPARWSRDARDWSPVEAVALNPEWDAVIGAYCRAEDKTCLLA